MQSRESGNITSSTTKVLNCETNVLWTRRLLGNMANGSTDFQEGPRSCKKRVLDCLSMDIHSPLKSSSSTIDDIHMKLFQERRGEATATQPTWPLTQHSAANEPVLVLGNISEKRKKTDSGTSCRLFGIDLISHSSSINPVHITISASQDPVPAASMESEQQSEVSKISKEGKTTLQATPKDIQSKQNCSLRSRTKVNRLLTGFTL